MLLPLREDLTKIKIYDKLDLCFLSDYEYDILTSFYIKKEVQQIDTILKYTDFKKILNSCWLRLEKNICIIITNYRN